jgi:hypothetical protein
MSLVLFLFGTAVAGWAGFHAAYPPSAYPDGVDVRSRGIQRLTMRGVHLLFAGLGAWVAIFNAIILVTQ